MSWARDGRSWGLSLLAWVVLSLVATWPLVLHLPSAIVAGAEPALAMRNLWAVSQVDRQLVRHPFKLLEGNAFHPRLHALVYADTLIPDALLALPASLLGASPAVTYNLAFLAGMVLAGLMVQVLIHALTGSRWAAAFAGMAAVVAPARLELADRVQLFGISWLALVLVLELWFFRRPGLGRGAAVGAGVALAFLSAISTGMLAVVCVLALLPVHLVRERAWRRGRTWVALALGALVFVLLVAPVVPKRVRFLMAGAEARTPNAGVAGADQPKPWLRATGGIFPTSLLLLLGAAGVAVAVLRPQPLWRGYALVLAPLAAGAVLAVRPLSALHADGSPRVFEPQALAAAYWLALVVLAGILVAFLDGPSLRRRLVLGLVSLVLVVESVSAPLVLAAVPASGLYRHLAALPGQAAVVELPADEAGPINGQYMAAAALYGKPLVNGYGPYLPRDYGDFAQGLESFPDPRSLTSLMQKGVEFVIVHGGAMAAADQAALGERLVNYREYLREEASFGPDKLYRLDNSVMARQALVTRLLETAKRLPSLTGGPCFEVGEELSYEVTLVRLFTAAHARLRVLQAEAPDELLLDLVAEPTAATSKFMGRGLSIEERVRRSDLRLEESRVGTDARGKHVILSSRFVQQGDNMVYATRLGPTVDVPADTYSLLSALYTLRCVPLKRGDFLQFVAASPGLVLGFDASVRGLETVTTPAGEFRCRHLRLQPPIDQRAAAPVAISLWVSDDARHLPVKAELTQSNSFYPLRIELVGVGKGSP